MSRYFHCVFYSLLALLVAWSHEGFAASTIGNSTIIVKTVTGTLEEGTRNLEFNDDIYRNEVVETFEESATEIKFLDETTLGLGPNTKITLDRFVFDPNPENSEVVLTITKGALRFVTGILPSDAYKIHTPIATIGIRGTVIDLIVKRVAKEDGTVLISVNLSVVEGEADFINCAGETTLVPIGLSSTIQGTATGCSEASAPGSRPADISEALRVRDRLLAQ